MSKIKRYPAEQVMREIDFSCFPVEIANEIKKGRGFVVFEIEYRGYKGLSKPLWVLWEHVYRK